jgi:hypothetical protein
MLGDSTGVFQRTVDLFDYRDTTCATMLYRYEIKGNYALVGQSTCDGQCRVRT